MLCRPPTDTEVSALGHLTYVHNKNVWGMMVMMIMTIEVCKNNCRQNITSSQMPTYHKSNKRVRICLAIVDRGGGWMGGW